MSTKPFKPSRNTYLALLAAWDQFQVFRGECKTWNDSLRPPHIGNRRDPIRDFPGVDIEKVRDTTHEWVTSKRRIHPSEIRKFFAHFEKYKLVTDRPSEGYTFGGQGQGEDLGAELNKLRDYFTNPDNRRWWPALVVLSAMKKGISMNMLDLRSATGLLQDQVRLGWSQLGQGFVVKTTAGDERKFKGKVMKTSPDKVRLPDSLLYDGNDPDLDDIVPDAADEALEAAVAAAEAAAETVKLAASVTKALPDPDKMHGAADGFPGTDDAGGGMYSPSADTIRKELKKIGGPPASDVTVRVPSPSPAPPSKGNGDARVGQIIVPVSAKDYHLVSAYLSAIKGKGVAEELESHLDGLLALAKEHKRTGELRKRLADLKAERDRALSEMDAKILKIEAQITP